MICRLISAGILALAAAAMPASGYQAVFDGEDPALKIKSGTSWLPDKAGAFHGYFRYSSVAGNGSSVAVWTLDGLPPGNYTLEFYVDKGDYAQNVPYTIEHDGGITSVTASQNYVEAGWKSLGNFHFTHAGRVTQTDAWTGAGTVAIADALRVTLNGTPVVPTMNVVPPEVTFVIDDLGRLNPEDSSTATGQLYQNVPGATYAVIPSFPYVAQCLQTAASLGIETILHQPLQYNGQPNSISSDPTRVYVSMTDEQIQNVVQSNVNSMRPYIAGVNNHQGSRFSQYSHGMDVLVAYLKTQGLFYFDSRTITDSLGYSAARSAGMLTNERDLFIDGSSAQATMDLVLSLARRCRYSPNNSYTMIAHQGAATTSGVLQVQTDLRNMGVGVRPLSRNLSLIVETDFLPKGSAVTYTGTWGTTTTDMINQELNDGDARTFLGHGSGSARFTPDLPTAGMYRVFVGFANDTNNSTNTRITVAGNNGSSYITLNQSVDGGRWHYIGTYPFLAGTTGYIELDNSLAPSETRPLRADAIKFNYDGQLPGSDGDWQNY